MTTPVEMVHGPFADPARAAEIALLGENKFGLAEFTELTGVGIGDYGIYRAGPAGISLRASESLADLTAFQQNEIHKATRLLTLGFPCAPADFMRWYDATRGTNGASDFLLAKGFAEELRRHEEPSSHGVERSVSSDKIVAAFEVRTDGVANAKWWDLRLRNPGRYGLETARAVKGVAQRPSRWYPVRVAGWLVDRKLFTRDAALRAMEKRFPDYDVDFLQV